MKIVISLSFLLVSSLAAAQDADSIRIRKFYNENAILWTGGYGSFFIDNKRYPMSQLEEKIKFSPEALEEYRGFKRDRAASIVFLAVSATLLFVAPLAEERNAKLGLLGGSLVAASLSIPFSIGAGRHMGRVVYVHNRDMLVR